MLQILQVFQSTAAGIAGHRATQASMCGDNFSIAHVGRLVNILGARGHKPRPCRKLFSAGRRSRPAALRCSGQTSPRQGRFERSPRTCWGTAASR
nr:MAG TPA: hypothetical protein [Caudoviricetes sp.]